MSDENKATLICRTCLNKIECLNRSVSINSHARTPLYKKLTIREIMEKCIPEIDLEICDQAVICSSCHDFLITTYSFKSKCFETEGKIYSFMEKNNLVLGAKLDLSCLMQQSDTGGEETNERSMEIKESNCTEENETQNDATNETERINVIDSDTDDTSSRSDQDNARPSLKRQYSCGRCEYKTYRRNLLERHWVGKCKNKAKSNRYRCDECSYSTIRKRNLRRHKFTHGGNRPFVCGICDKGFTERNLIRDHMYKHSGYKLPYRCGEGSCNAKFSRKCSLISHIVTHRKYKPYMCKLCSKGFAEQGQWDWHMENVHGISL